MATLSLHSLFELRSNLMRGTVMLDVEANNLAHIAGETGQQTSTPIMFACGQGMSVQSEMMCGNLASIQHSLPWADFLGRRRRPYIVFSFRYSYGFMFVTRIYIYIYIYISGNQDGGARVVYCFRTLKIIFVAISSSFIRTKFDKKHVLIE